MIFNHIRKLKEEGKKIGITFSTFDMLHAGHIAMLAEAKNHCDYLIAGLQTDPTMLTRAFTWAAWPVVPM